MSIHLINTEGNTMFFNLFETPKLAQSITKTVKAADTAIANLADNSIAKTETRSKLAKAALIDWSEAKEAKQAQAIALNKAKRTKAEAEHTVALKKIELETAAIKANANTELTKVAIDLVGKADQLTEVEQVEAKVAMDFLNPFLSNEQ